MVYKSENERFMAKALELASKGVGYTSPNPAVGCVIVKNGEIIAGDYHHKAGQPHAEALALKSAGDRARGADLYVTLEPCSIFGRTPPCTEAIVAAGIKRVIVGAVDANPKVNGEGIRKLREAGIEVISGVLEDKCSELNRGYNKFITSGLPLVTIKFAQSLDGRIATKTGSAKWISSPQSRKFAHKLRAEHNAIAVGANTANTDDPQLTVRAVKGNNPVRVIITKSGNLRTNLKMFSDKEAPTIVATGNEGESKLANQRFVGTEIINIDNNSGGLDLRKMLEFLGQRGMTSLLIEGGSGTSTAFIKAGLADRAIIFIAPIIIGYGVDSIGDLGTESIDKAIKLVNIKRKMSGPDYVVIGDLA